MKSRLKETDLNPSLRPIVMWALTYRCNLRCRYCYLFTSENEESLGRSDATPDVVESIAENLTNQDDWRPEIVWLTGGEPTLHAQLSWLIHKFESAGVMTVITTHGVIESVTALSLAHSRPRGIMVSLDLADPQRNNALRGGGNRVLETIDLLVREKDPYTTLGVAVVITKQNRLHLKEFAHFLEKRGVEYLSLNPLHNHSRKTVDLTTFSGGDVDDGIDSELADISESSSLLLPSTRYLQLLNAHLKQQEAPRQTCPATYEYAFIAPWGQVYPCSSEFWHRDNRMAGAPFAANVDFAKTLPDLRKRLGSGRFSTGSDCYSTRCMGCWKLYYDSVFTRR
ncbi:MAG TPA: radical SAM protein [Pyrinomonadaceae bacterium]|nr:radical SAM protein [Pyrinomonadaceae bacterium]